MAQNAILIHLVWRIDHEITFIEKAAFFLGTVVITYLLSEESLLSEKMWAVPRALKFVRHIPALVPQIFTNQKRNSTGQLAFATFFLAWGYSCCRLLNTVLHTDDKMFILVAIISLAIHTTLMKQLWLNKPAKLQVNMN